MDKKLKSLYTFFRVIFLKRSWLAILALMSLVLGLLTYGMLGRLSYVQKGGHFITFLLILDLACLSALTILIVKQLIKVWISHRKGKAGSRLHGQMVLLFGVISVVPTLILTLFSAFFFHFGVQEWFDNKFSTGLSNASIISQAYFDEKKMQLGESLNSSSQELEKRVLQWEDSLKNLQEFLNIILKFNKLEGLVIYKEGTFLAASKELLSQQEDAVLTPWLQKPYKEVPIWAQELVNEGHVAVLENVLPGFMGGVYKFSTAQGDYYLLAWKKVQKEILSYALQTQAAAQDYAVLKSKKFEIQVAFSIIFAFVSLLILLGAIAVGLIISNALVTPIYNLIKGAHRVSDGKLDMIIPLPSGMEDLKVLVKSFNNMVQRLREQKDQLLQTNYSLEKRTVFMESVLEGVSSGIIELSIEGHIRIINDNALKLLKKEKKKNMVKLQDIFPQAQDLFSKVLKSPQGKSEGKVVYTYKGHNYTFFVRFSLQASQKKITGYVLTFDDLTKQIHAERQAAWADVARRIAHEIKNPLTPIQLSAERLKRRYLNKLEGEDAEVFKKCIDTIIRQVDTIGSMVKEFSSFTRMPEVQFKEENLNLLIKESVYLQEQAYPDIRFDIKLPSKDIFMDLDSKKMTQVFNNLLKNAVESIQENPTVKEREKKIKCELEDFSHEVIIIIEDAGKGWLEGIKNSLAKPYFTTRVKGTGLGLSIVARIVQDHNGLIYFEESSLGGAKVRIVIPKEMRQNAYKEETI